MRNSRLWRRLDTVSRYWKLRIEPAEPTEPVPVIEPVPCELMEPMEPAAPDPMELMEPTDPEPMELSEPALGVLGMWLLMAEPKLPMLPPLKPL